MLYPGRVMRTLRELIEKLTPQECELQRGQRLLDAQQGRGWS